MGSKAEYEQRKRQRTITKSLGLLSSEADKINIIVGCMGILMIHAETRSVLSDLVQRRDVMMDELDRTMGQAPTSDAFRCGQVQITIRTLFAEVTNRKPSCDFPTVSELADYLIAKMRPADEIAQARGYAVTVGADDVVLALCATDEECVEQFTRLFWQKGYQVTLPV